MINTPTPLTASKEVTILGRLLVNGKEELKPDLARYFLALEFTQEDRARMHELAVRNQDGQLSAEEKEELLGFAKAGCLLGILQSKARKSLKTRRKK